MERCVVNQNKRFNVKERSRLDLGAIHRHSREGGNPVYFGLHGYKKAVWIPAFAGMTVFFHHPVWR